MALSFKNRKRLSVFVLLVGLPVYIVGAIQIVNLFDRPPILFELVIYVGLGVAWALPLKWIFSGVGKADPDQKKKAE